MSQDIDHIVHLWETEQARDVLLAEYQGMKSRISDVEAELSTAGEALQQFVAKRAVAKEQERAHNRKLAEYGRQRDKTKSWIENGQAHDFLVAQRQLDQFIELIDNEETELLELMEQLEEMDEELAVAEEAQRFRESRLAEAKRALAERMPSLRAEVQAATAARDAAKTAVPRSHHTRYDDLRRRGRSCVAEIEGTSCSACRMNVPSTHIAEVRRGITLHTCSNCKRFLRIVD